MSGYTFFINGVQFIEIPDSELCKPGYGPKPFSSDSFFARHVKSGCLAVIAADHSDSHILPKCITSIEDAHQIFAFADRWYQWGMFRGASEKQQQFRLALGV